MRIQHNIPALNAYRNYNNNASALSKNLEKLSSGYRINRAGDDAAGLAISEKMRAQITGLDAAQKNVKDGISLVKTAEGAMQEVQDMLNRMTYLATQSANGTYDNEVDRANLQKEVDALCTEINRIADSTNFNGIKLLDGSMGVNTDSAVTNVVTNEYQKASTSLEAFNVRYVGNRPDSAAATGASFTVDLSELEITAAGSGTAAASHTISLTVGDAKIEVKINGTSVTAGSIATQLAASGGKGLQAASNATKEKLTASAGAYVKINGNVYEMAASGTSIKFTQVNVMDRGAAPVNPDYKVNVTIDAADGYNYTDTVNPQVQNPTQGIADGGSKQARVDVDIDFSKLKDGDKITVGSTTYTFKIGADSSVASGAGVIDLSDTFKTADDMKNSSLREEAMVKITEAMNGNGNWSVGNAGLVGNSGTLTFQSTGSHAVGNFTDLTTQEKVLKQFSTSADEKAASTTFNFDATKLKAGDTITIGDTTYEFTTDGKTSVEGRVGINIGATGVVTADNASGVMDKLEAAIETDFFVGSGSAKKFEVTLDKENKKITITAQDNANTSGVYENQSTVRMSVGGSGLTLQIGDTAEKFNQLNVSIDDMHVDALGLSNIDISTQTGAADAVEKIKNAINMVSSTRGDLGATQNRLEHTTNNLSIMKENITDAESAIRDTDVADEMTKYTKNNILLQSAQAMLAQANQLPQGVLQLLG